MIETMEREFFDLFELQHRLKRGVESLFPNRIWVRAEVSAIKARNGGHCYWSCPRVMRRDW